jgi:hypothetical protein
MNTTTMNLHARHRRTAPRGAVWIGSAFASLLKMFRAAPAERNAARDVRRARALAAEWAVHDPRSAADLSAAIDRFELENRS